MDRHNLVWGVGQLINWVTGWEARFNCLFISWQGGGGKIEVDGVVIWNNWMSCPDQPHTHGDHFKLEDPVIQLFPLRSESFYVSTALNVQ